MICQWRRYFDMDQQIDDLLPYLCLAPVDWPPMSSTARTPMAAQSARKLRLLLHIS